MKSDGTFQFSTYMDVSTFTDFSFFNSFLFHGRWISLLLFPVVMSGLGILNLVTGSSFLFGLFLILALVLPGLYFLFYRVSLRNQIKANNIEERRLVYTTRFNNEEIEVSNQNETQGLGWAQIYRVFRYKNYFYLYISRSRAYILPAEGLGEEESADDFWSYAQSMTQEGQCRAYRNHECPEGTS